MKSGSKDRKAVNQESRRIPFPETLLAKPAGIRPSKTSRWRAAALILLNLLMVAHLIQWWVMGRTVSPIEPSETMHTLQRGAVNAGFIFFSLAILATLIFGRFVCGWGCHILALQDFCGWMLKKWASLRSPFDPGS
ncbi:MAG: 4Fe-4S binding protein [Candidatus Binatia bacterium]